MKYGKFSYRMRRQFIHVVLITQVSHVDKLLPYFVLEPSYYFILIPYIMPQAKDLKFKFNSGSL